MSNYHFAKWLFPLKGWLRKICNTLIRIRRINVVIVFGMSRSGTTFLGEVLTLNQERSVYIHEPVKHLMRQKYDDVRGNKPAYWDYVFHEELIPHKVHFLVLTVLAAILKGRVRKGGVLCIKPITMLDSMGETSAALSCSVLYISRHPCGWVESMARQTAVDSEHFHEDRLNTDTLRDMGSHWAETNANMQNLFQGHPDWRWVVFEDLCLEPEQSVHKLYEELSIEWTEAVAGELAVMTNTPSDDFYGTNRRSRNQVDKWQSALSAEQIEAVRLGCAGYSTEIYENF